MKKLILLKHKQKPITSGHPWVFPMAMERSASLPATGELVEILTAENESVGYGVYNEHSLYRVRLLCYTHEKFGDITLPTILQNRFSAAVKLRQQFDLPNATTNAYRLFNSEADGLSGLTIDIYGDLAIISSSAYWVEQNRALIEETLHNNISFKDVVWFCQRKLLDKDGWTNQDNGDYLRPKISVTVNSIQYEIDFATTQKTGLFLDQRENHERLGILAKNKRVLDLFCFTGGFALNAAAHGALNITAIDSSQPAIEHAKQNAERNSLKNIEFLAGDAREFLHTAGDYDLVIVDPPKIVPSYKHLHQGEQYYRFIHGELLKVMRPNTLLFTCNCSSAITEEHFLQIINQSAIQYKRTVKVLAKYGAAIDHPTLVHFPEGNYLHGVLLAV